MWWWWWWLTEVVCMFDNCLAFYSDFLYGRKVIYNVNLERGRRNEFWWGVGGDNRKQFQESQEKKN